MSDKYPGKTVIGLTGNIATGKSLVRKMLEHLGAFGIDADSLVHRAMAPGGPAFDPIVETFGKWIVAADGTIDRAKLGNIVFSDPAALKNLESITHPLVRQAVDILVSRSKQDVVAIEAIKLLEGELASRCDTVWVVDAPEEVQLKRLMSKRKLSEADALQRIRTQNPQKDKLAQAAVIINNAGNYESTYEQVQTHLAALTGTDVGAAETEQEVAVTISAPSADVEITIKKAGPKQAQAIADFLNKMQKRSLTRSDVMMHFGETAYMLALAGEQVIGVAAWQVENLITRIPDFVIAPNAPVEVVVKGLLDNVEKASRDLQSEIVLLFVPDEFDSGASKLIEAEGFDATEIGDLKIPDWREAAREASPGKATLLTKKLRTDRVLKPI